MNDPRTPTPDTIARAVWHQNGQDSWLLKRPIKAGGAVLAIVVQEKARRYQWTAYTTPIQIGAELSARAAKSAARKALREAQEGRSAAK